MKRLVYGLIVALLPTAALAHNWYSGLYSYDNLLCCGGNDCAPLPSGSVREVPGGFHVDYEGPFAQLGKVSIHEFVNRSHAKPSKEEDGAYHMCVVGGQIRCFFYPNRGY